MNSRRKAGFLVAYSCTHLDSLVVSESSVMVKAALTVCGRGQDKRWCTAVSKDSIDPVKYDVLAYLVFT
jgi:hypothetical protein